MISSLQVMKVKKYKVAAVNETNIFTFHTNECGQYEVDKGIDTNLLKVLAEKLHFRYEIVTPNDGQWGAKTKYGNWTGMIGLLDRKEADFGVEAISVSYDRSQAVHFSHSYFCDKTTFAMRAPALLSKEFVFIYPFHFLVWLFIGLSLFLCSWFLSMFNNEKLSSKRKQRKWKFSHWRKNLNHLIILLLGQGTYKMFQESAERIFLTFWSLSRSVLAFSYAGVLLSFLMVPLKQPSIKTLLELRNAVVKGNVRCLILAGSAIQSFIMNAKDGITKDFGNSLRKHPENILSRKVDLPSLLQQGYFAMFSSLFHFDTLLNPIGQEKYFISKDVMKEELISVAFRKGFCCIQDFNRMILRIQAAGLYEKWVQDLLFHLRLKAENETREDNVRPLALDDVVGAFSILLYGYGISIIVLASEKMLFRYNKMERATKRKHVVAFTNGQ